MDFMKLLRSLEEALYEVASWVLFYPITLWRTLAHPIATMAYAETELTDKAEEQYDDALSPPIFLLITLLLTHMVVTVAVPTANDALPASISSESNLLAFRAVLFSIFPLLLALARLRVRGATLTRSTLQPSFYGQCYLAGPFVIGLSAGVLLLEIPGGMLAGITVLVATIVWYVVIEAVWLVRTGPMHPVQAALLSFATVLLAAVLMLVGVIGTAFALRG